MGKIGIRARRCVSRLDKTMPSKQTPNSQSQQLKQQGVSMSHPYVHQPWVVQVGGLLHVTLSPGRMMMNIAFWNRKGKSFWSLTLSVECSNPEGTSISPQTIGQNG